MNFTDLIDNEVLFNVFFIWDSIMKWIHRLVLICNKEVFLNGGELTEFRMKFLSMNLLIRLSSFTSYIHFLTYHANGHLCKQVPCGRILLYTYKVLLYFVPVILDIWKCTLLLLYMPHFWLHIQKKDLVNGILRSFNCHHIHLAKIYTQLWYQAYTLGGSIGTDEPPSLKKVHHSLIAMHT